MATLAFRASIERAANGGAFVTIPSEIHDALGGGGRIPVTASFDGIEYRGSIVRMSGIPILGVLKTIRERIGKSPGDQVDVTVAVDIAPRTVDVPADLAAALEAAPAAAASFAGLSFSHQRQYVEWIDEAKRADTRGRRIRQTIERLG